MKRGTLKRPSRMQKLFQIGDFKRHGFYSGSHHNDQRRRLCAIGGPQNGARPGTFDSTLSRQAYSSSSSSSIRSICSRAYTALTIGYIQHNNTRTTGDVQKTLLFPSLTIRWHDGAFAFRKHDFFVHGRVARVRFSPIFDNSSVTAPGSTAQTKHTDAFSTNLDHWGGGGNCVVWLTRATSQWQDAISLAWCPRSDVRSVTK